MLLLSRPLDQVIRILLALSILLAATTAPAAVAAERAAPPPRAGQVAAPAADYAELAVRTTTGLEVLRELGGRLPLNGPRTAQACPLPTPSAPPAPTRAGQVAPRREVRPDLSLPCGEHPPYLPAAPPLAG